MEDSMMVSAWRMVYGLRMACGNVMVSVWFCWLNMCLNWIGLQLPLIHSSWAEFISY